MLKNLTLFTMFLLQQVNSSLFMILENLRTTETFFSIKVIAFDEKTVLITSNSTIRGDMEKTSSTKDSIFLFSNLAVIYPGIIKITAKGLDNNNISEKIIYVEQAEKKINIQVPNEPILENALVNLTINVTNQYGQYFSNETKMNLNNGIEEKIVTTTDSIYFEQISYPDKGNYTINVLSSENINNTKVVPVYEYYLEIITNNIKNFSSKTIQLIEINLDSIYQENNVVELKLQCLEVCSGSKFRLHNGESIEKFNFEIVKNQKFYFYVISSGTFRWEARTMNLTGTSNSFKVTNSPYKILSYYSNSSITAYFPVLYTIEILGDDNEIYTEPIEVTIKDSYGASSVKEKKLVVKNGTESIEIYYKAPVSDASYKITCDKITEEDNIIEDSINVYPNSLVLKKNENWYPEYYDYTFNFNISVFDYEKQKKETQKGIYNITIKFVPSDYQVSVLANNGEANIRDLYAKSYGTYRLQISCPSCATVLTEKFTINSGYCGSPYSVYMCMFTLGIFFFGLASIQSDGFVDKDNGVLGGNFFNYFKVFQPFLSLFRRQPGDMRRLASYQILSSEFILLMNIWLVYYILDTSDNPSGKESEEFTIEDLKFGAIAFAFQQIWAFIMFFFNIMLIEYEKCISVSSFFIICTIFGSIFGMVDLMIIYCFENTLIWLINFIIFSFVDLIVAKSVLALISCCIVFKKAKVEFRSFSEQNIE